MHFCAIWGKKEKSRAIGFGAIRHRELAEGVEDFARGVRQWKEAPNQAVLVTKPYGEAGTIATETGLLVCAPIRITTGTLVPTGALEGMRTLT